MLVTVICCTFASAYLIATHVPATLIRYLGSRGHWLHWHMHAVAALFGLMWFTAVGILPTYLVGLPYDWSANGTDRV